ncbi:leucine--tRNA ligase, mitochondrial isoform X2 [Hylaeus volcanicus]|uniref:leucine--tRNA ligase, mitochondrial isoform X2 n=1 Tax=Hylaeus volcanicus TaxID=313075 RepID=UPI0023B7D509|nr:leucine--tRNA ligase, mitochondrial isoform X2 [Hylaeus volcanicus]
MLLPDVTLTHSIKKNIEKYWRDKINLRKYDETDNIKEKFYVLSMFPYPSGILHMGHVRVYTISDAVARFYQLKGYNVLHPMGWDAFGLPAENAAIEKQVDPVEWTNDNIIRMRNQMNLLNYNFDWDREFATCDPEYYRWTQELFLKLFEKDLVYQKESYVNWDPIDQTVLAEEQVDENNCSWRSGAQVEKRLLKQWFIRTTPFAQSLLNGLCNPILKDWKDIIKMQKNWIGECNGTSFEFQLISNIPNYPKTINVWTNVPEFIEYAKFVAISPKSLLNYSEYCKDVNDEIKVMDVKVLNPFSGEEMPVFITDKVEYQPFRDTYIGIPSASMDDYNFSEAVGIEFLRHSIRNYEEQQQKLSEVLSKAREWKIGGYSVSSRLQDWLISRQRYWGTPIPIIHCSNCGAQPVPSEQLPVVLPKITSSFSNKKSTLLDCKDWLNISCPKCGGQATRESDTMDTFVDSSWYFLRYIDPKNTKQMFDLDKVKTIFPVNLYVGGKEHAVLHLYYARFMSHFLHSEGLLPSQEPFQQLLVQGMVMGKTYQIENTGKYVKADEVEEKEGQYVLRNTKEPVVISWEKMSKSKHNGIDPLELIDKYGIDTTRLLILANVAPTKNRNWSDETIPGILNWQNRIWNTVKWFIDYRNSVSLEELQTTPTDPKFVKDDSYMFDSRNYFLKSATYSITNSQQLSIGISRLQGLTNSLHKVSVECKNKSREFERALAAQLIMLAPFAPHFASELWAAFCSAKHHLISENEVKLNKNVMEQDWPEVDMEYKMELILYVDGTCRGKLKIPRCELDKLSPEEALNLGMNQPELQKSLWNKKITETKLLSVAGYDSKMYIITEKLKETIAT